MRIIRSSLCPLVAVCVLLLAGCGPKPLDPAGEVRLWMLPEDPLITSTAAAQRGLTLGMAPSSPHWTARIGTEDGPDLVFVEWSRELAKAEAEGKLLDLTGYLPRLPGKHRFWPGGPENGSAGMMHRQSFIPASIGLWGLWYNQDVLAKAGIEPPRTLAELEASFERLSDQGYLPLSLGGSTGWSVLAWIGLLDLRLNGAEAHQALLKGERSFADPSLLPVYGTLLRWRSRRWLDPDASTQQWNEAFGKVKNGTAAFMLMGSFAASSAGNAPLAFMTLPPANPSLPRAETAQVQGFALAANAGKPEAALALVGSYLEARATSPAGDGSRVSALRPASRQDTAPSTLKASQEAILATTSLLLPPLDRVLENRALNEIYGLLRIFLSPQVQMNAESLGRNLEAARR